MSKPRWGWIEISEPMLREMITGTAPDSSRAAWSGLFGQSIVVETVRVWGLGKIRYLIYHPAFDEVEDGVLPPEYHVQFEQERSVLGGCEVVTVNPKFIRKT